MTYGSWSLQKQQIDVSSELPAVVTDLTQLVLNVREFVHSLGHINWYRKFLEYNATSHMNFWLDMFYYS